MISDTTAGQPSHASDPHCASAEERQLLSHIQKTTACKVLDGRVVSCLSLAPEKRLAVLSPETRTSLRACSIRNWNVQGLHFSETEDIPENLHARIQNSRSFLNSGTFELLPAGDQSFESIRLVRQKKNIIPYNLSIDLPKAHEVYAQKYVYLKNCNPDSAASKVYYSLCSTGQYRLLPNHPSYLSPQESLLLQCRTDDKGVWQWFEVARGTEHTTLLESTPLLRESGELISKNEQAISFPNDGEHHLQPEFTRVIMKQKLEKYPEYQWIYCSNKKALKTHLQEMENINDGTRLHFTFKDENSIHETAAAVYITNGKVYCYLHETMSWNNSVAKTIRSQILKTLSDTLTPKPVYLLAPKELSQVDYYSCAVFAIKAHLFFAKYPEQLSQLMTGTQYPKNGFAPINISKLPPPLVKLCQKPDLLSPEQLSSPVRQRNSISLKNYLGSYAFKSEPDDKPANCAALVKRYKYLQRVRQHDLQESVQAKQHPDTLAEEQRISGSHRQSLGQNEEPTTTPLTPPLPGTSGVSGAAKQTENTANRVSMLESQLLTNTEQLGIRDQQIKQLEQEHQKALSDYQKIKAMYDEQQRAMDRLEKSARSTSQELSSTKDALVALNDTLTTRTYQVTSLRHSLERLDAIIMKGMDELDRVPDSPSPKSTSEHNSPTSSRSTPLQPSTPILWNIDPFEMSSSPTWTLHSETMDEAEDHSEVRDFELGLPSTTITLPDTVEPSTSEPSTSEPSTPEKEPDSEVHVISPPAPEEREVEQHPETEVVVTSPTPPEAPPEAVIAPSPLRPVQRRPALQRRSPLKRRKQAATPLSGSRYQLTHKKTPVPHRVIHAEQTEKDKLRELAFLDSQQPAFMMEVCSWVKTQTVPHPKIAAKLNEAGVPVPTTYRALKFSGPKWQAHHINYLCWHLQRDQGSRCEFNHDDAQTRTLLQALQPKSQEYADILLLHITESLGLDSQPNRTISFNATFKEKLRRLSKILTDRGLKLPESRRRSRVLHKANQPELRAYLGQNGYTLKESGCSMHEKGLLNKLANPRTPENQRAAVLSRYLKQNHYDLGQVVGNQNKEKLTIKMPKVTGLKFPQKTNKAALLLWLVATSGHLKYFTPASISNELIYSALKMFDWRCATSETKRLYKQLFAILAHRLTVDRRLSLNASRRQIAPAVWIDPLWKQTKNYPALRAGLVSPEFRDGIVLKGDGTRQQA